MLVLLLAFLLVVEQVFVAIDQFKASLLPHWQSLVSRVMTFNFTESAAIGQEVEVLIKDCCFSMKSAQHFTTVARNCYWITCLAKIFAIEIVQAVVVATIKWEA